MLTEHGSHEPLAIVGIGCRFPGGADSAESSVELAVQRNRRHLRRPRNTLERRAISRSRIRRRSARSSPDEADSSARSINSIPSSSGCRRARRTRSIRSSASCCTPRGRRWKTAGIPADGLAGTDVGVFVGGFTLDYQLLQNQGRTSRYRFKSHSATGMMMTMLANRISHAFDFRGPSMTIDTACSGSLVAVHLAAQSIWNGECDLALAGGVNIMIGPNTAIAESKSGFLSPEGRSKAFDDSADGYARGRRRRDRRHQTASAGARRRRRDLRTDPRHGGVPGRPHRRHHRASRGSPRSCHQDGSSTSGCPARPRSATSKRTAPERPSATPSRCGRSQVR